MSSLFAKERSNIFFLVPEGRSPMRESLRVFCVETRNVEKVEVNRCWFCGEEGIFKINCRAIGKLAVWLKKFIRGG